MAALKEIKFIAVARRSDKAVLASRIHTQDKSYVSRSAKRKGWPGSCTLYLVNLCCIARQDFVSNVNKVLSSPGWASVTTDKVSVWFRGLPCLLKTTTRPKHVLFTVSAALSRRWAEHVLCAD
jgi:hypothetical protein